MAANKDFNVRCATGIQGLDYILGGGLPCHSLYSVQGEPGSGKTTFALQFLLEGKKAGHRALYITFSETAKELERVAVSHDWDISGVDVMDLSSLEDQLNPDSQNTLFHPSEIELNQVFSLILKKIEEVNPSRIVFDSVSEMRLLAETPLRYRRQILALKQLLATKEITVLFLDDLTVPVLDLQIHSIAHGVIHLSRTELDFGSERRRLRIIKLRGVSFIGGYHDAEIVKGGLVVYPRMISSQHPKEAVTGQLSSGNKEMDQLLGGGLDKGTTTLFVGPSGSGKSNLTMNYAQAALRNGIKVAYFTFEETMANFHRRCETLGMGVREQIENGSFKLQKIDPSELSPGAFANLIQDFVRDEGVGFVAIDSLNGYIQAMTQEKFLILQLHELLGYLNNQGVVTAMTLAQQGMMGHMASPIDITYLADTVVMTRFFETKGAVKKAMSVIKKRTGLHETTIREFMFEQTGLKVGPALTEFEGVLTGVPRYIGRESRMLK